MEVDWVVLASKDQAVLRYKEWEEGVAEEEEACRTGRGFRNSQVVHPDYVVEHISVENAAYPLATQKVVLETVLLLRLHE